MFPLAGAYEPRVAAYTCERTQIDQRLPRIVCHQISDGIYIGLG